MTMRLLSRFQVRHLYAPLPIALYAVLANGPIADNSFLWHVRAGSVQLEDTHVLTVDPFSYLVGGTAWRTQSWVVELLYARLEWLLQGVAWAPVLVAVVGATALSMTALAMYRSSRSMISTAVWLLVGVWLLAPFAQPRPVIFSYALLAVLGVVLMLGDRAEWAAVPIVWVWAGIHGSWVIGLGLMVLVAIVRRSAKLGWITSAALVMTVMTAHGLGTWQMLFAFARNSGALDYIQEWQPPDFGDIAQAPYLLVMIGVLLAAVFGKIVPRELWVILPFLVFGFTTRRSVPVAALVLLPFAARSISAQLPRTAPKQPLIPVAVVGLMVTVVVAVYVQPHPLLETDRFPSDVAIDAAGNGRFFHDDVTGGYLIYRDGPGKRMYIDDRAELYGAANYEDFRAARSGDYADLFARMDFEAAIVKTEWPLFDALSRDGWRVVYSDAEFEVLARSKR